MVTQTALRLRAAVVIVVLGLASLAGAPMASAASASALKFDSAAWKTESGGRRKQRARMLGDLQANYLKTGMSRKEVVILLGPPDVDKGDELTYFWGSEYSESGGWSLFGGENDGGMLVFFLEKKSKIKNIRAIRWNED